MIALIDNYDSFSYNLYQLIGEVNPDIKVYRNDEVTVANLIEMKPEAVILSPGPGKPSDAGICIEAARELGDDIPVLGVCLGHQSICEAYGATVSHAKEMMHGKTSVIELDTDSALFAGMEKKITVARYHSLAAIKETIPDVLRVTAVASDGEIMAIEHVSKKIYGVQFHPESVLTPDGIHIIRNFLQKQ